jgi:hypothetical protein
LLYSQKLKTRLPIQKPYMQLAYFLLRYILLFAGDHMMTFA